MSLNLKPINGNIIVKVVEEDTTQKSGIRMGAAPPTEPDVAVGYEVVAICDELDVTLTVGDVVFVSPHVGYTYVQNGQKYKVFNYSVIFMINN